MSDSFAPPPGPPPTAAPQVPEGYKAQWNEQYKEWFYVNIYTKKSQWEKPTEPCFPDNEPPPPGPPPRYSPGQVGNITEQANSKQNSLPITESQNHVSDAETAGHQKSEDGVLTRGSYDEPPRYGQQPLPPRETKPKTGILGKLLGKSSGSSGSSDIGPGNNGPGQYNGQQPQYGYSQQTQYRGQPPIQQYPSQGYSQQGYQPQGYQPQGYPSQGFPPQGYPPQGYPSQGYPTQGYPPQGYPNQGYAPQGYAPQGYAPQGYPQQVYNGQSATKSKPGGGKMGATGLGAAGGAALGVGAGLVGGMLISDAIESHDERIYEQGYEDAQEDAADDDGDCGGDDF